MKAKRVGKNDANTKITQQCVIEEETEVLGVKPLHRPLSGNQSTRQSVGIHGLARDPPSLIYPMYLSPLNSYSNKVSQNRVLSSSLDPATSSMLHLPSLASSNAFQQHQNLTDTLKGCGKCLGYQPLNGMEMKRQELRKITSKYVQICGYNNL